MSLCGYSYADKTVVPYNKVLRRPTHTKDMLRYTALEYLTAS